jgi:hypothetical protein
MCIISIVYPECPGLDQRDSVEALGAAREIKETAFLPHPFTVQNMFFFPSSWIITAMPF